MGIEPGTSLGHFEILESIGVGGMGEVYRARDSKLGRDVAIKVLPEDFAADPERLARFEREAKTLASLNHSNIGALYDFQTGRAKLRLSQEASADTPARTEPRPPPKIRRSRFWAYL